MSIFWLCTTLALARPVAADTQEIGTGAPFDPWTLAGTPPRRGGYEWVPGATVEGAWVPGYYQATDDHRGYVFERGHWEDGVYFDGYWRPASRRGRVWVEGRYEGTDWVPGRWARVVSGL
jgi:WXXGXW repeat (2 copies)